MEIHLLTSIRAIMQTFYHISELKEYLNILRQEGKSIGFVPTMGALHKGHISLIDRAKSENDIVVCSIFVNPIQFNDARDLEKYPRIIDADKKMLATAECDILFLPSVEEMYPKPDTTVFDFGMLDKVMEGKFRPGHFNGVAIVVRHLLNIIEPDNAYFGQKDYQQLLIIKQLVKMLDVHTNIIACPIVREADGLAMSSRNVLLSAHERKIASLIPRTLFKIKEKCPHSTINELKEFVINESKADNLLQIEYFEIVNAENLMPVEHFNEAKEVIACIAVKVGGIRLIDNIILFP